MQNSDYDLANRISLAGDPLNNDQITALLLRELNVGGGMDHDEMTATLRAVLGPYIDNMMTLAEAVKQHVESGGNAGTHAYDMIAAVASEEAKNTDMLIAMVAATVLSKLIDQEGGGRANISFSPLDMDEMHKRYILETTHEGLETVVRIVPRKHIAGSLKLSYDPDGHSPVPAKPQAEAKTEEPHWFARVDGKRLAAADRHSAEQAIRESSDPVGQVENRRCPRPDCPAPAHVDNCLAGFCPNKGSK